MLEAHSSRTGRNTRDEKYHNKKYKERKNKKAAVRESGGGRESGEMSTRRPAFPAGVLYWSVARKTHK